MVKGDPMTRFGFVTALFAAGAGALLSAPAVTPGSRTPVLLELFTSEGCSSCPPADRLLEYLDTNQPVPGADLIVLSEHVDYWDSSSWRDRFSSSQYTARQQEYTNKYHLNGVYTPQLVIDGHFGLVGSDARGATSAIRQAIREPKVPIAISNVTRDGDRLTAHIDLPESGQDFKGGRGTLFVAIADNRAESHVGGGENIG